jgi:tetratricopeptide (TPR) repeat protein
MNSKESIIGNTAFERLIRATVDGAKRNDDVFVATIGEMLRRMHSIILVDFRHDAESKSSTKGADVGMHTHRWRVFAENLPARFSDGWVGTLRQPTFSPIELAADHVRPFVDAVTNGTASPDVDALVGLMKEKYERLVRDVPELQRIRGSDDPVANHDMIVHELLPVNMLPRRWENREPSDIVNARIRLASRLSTRSPMHEWHAAMRARVATRGYERRVILSAVAEGFSMLRETRSIDDREYFEAVEKSLGETVLKCYVFYKALQRAQDVETAKREGQSEFTWLTSATEDATSNARKFAREKTLDAATDFFRVIDPSFWMEYGDDFREPVQSFLHARNQLEKSKAEQPREPAPLRETIDARRCAAELERARASNDAHVLEAKEREIVSRVLGELLRYPHASKHPHGTTGIANSPAFVVRERMIDCFTGPWLAATMLMECGFRESDILYCDVQTPSLNTVGTHGSLMVLLSSRKQLLVDVGFRTVRDVPLALYDAGTRKKANELFDLNKSPYAECFLPVLLELPHDQKNTHNVHPQMFVMPIQNGCAWGTLLAMANDSFNDKRYGEARSRYEMAHAFHPTSPDILCGIARCALAEGDRSEATLLLDECIRKHPDQYMSILQRALMHCDDGDIDAADTLLGRIVGSGKKWFMRQDTLNDAHSLRETLRQTLRKT